MKHDPRTVAHYDRDAAAYAAWSSQGRSYVRLGRFIEMLPAGASVLDAGCGAGWDSERLTAAGMAVTAIDASPVMVAEANRRQGVNAARQRFDELDHNNEFHGIWAHSSLQHVPRAELPETLRILSAALKPGGLFFFDVHKGRSHWRDSLDRLYCRYRRNELTDLLASVGLENASFQTTRGAGRDGTVSDRYLIECRQLNS